MILARSAVPASSLDLKPPDVVPKFHPADEFLLGEFRELLVVNSAGASRLTAIWRAKTAGSKARGLSYSNMLALFTSPCSPPQSAAARAGSAAAAAASPRSASMVQARGNSAANALASAPDAL